MKKNQKKDIKYPPNSNKKDQGANHNIPGKKNVSIEDNNKTILAYFKVDSFLKSTSTTIVQKKRQTMLFLNKDTTDSNNNYRLSKYNFCKSMNKNINSLKKLPKKIEEKENKIDVSKYILFNENFSSKINNIFTNNFISCFKRYIDEKNKNDKNNIEYCQKFNFSKIAFNKFIQQIFKNFINKYLLNTYHNLIYVPEKYMMKNNKKNDLNEIGLLSYNDKSNIFLEYSPINLSESNLFYPDLCSNISDFIKNFEIKKRNSSSNRALILYRPNEDFTAYINKIKLICSQLGYRLLIREDEINKLMNIDKLKEINQNYIIGSLQDKNIKYLKILDNISITEKWTNFIESNNVQIPKNEEQINKNKNKTQSTTDMTQAFSKRKNKDKKDDINILSSKTLTFIGHGNNNGIFSQESDKTTSTEYKIFQNYIQNILEKFNKRKNLILFVDTFDKNDDNIKYINQINTIIPTSKSPIIILTNNLYTFTDNLVIGNKSFHTRYIPYQIENEGIKQKENVIYMTFLILYFLVFIPQVNFDKKDNKENKIINKPKDKDKDKGLEKELNFVSNINDDSDLSNIDNDNQNYYLEKIKKTINNIFIDTKLSLHNNELFSSLITLSNVISIINNYELDNILVYLKNLIKYKLKGQNVLQNGIKQKIILLQNAILLDIEQYKIQNEFSINENISKISEICEKNSFLDYEYGSINKIAEKEYENKLKNYGINLGVDYNSESYFYTSKYCHDYKYSNNYNYINNDEIEERIIQDHKFYRHYYNISNIVLNKSEVSKFNIMLFKIINDEAKINEINKLFRKCPNELFIRYINAHIRSKYYSEFIISENKYCIPEKLLFFNYYNDYYLMEQIKSENNSKYNENEEEENNYDEEEEEEFYEEDN